MSSTASTVAIHVQVQLLRFNNPNEVFVVPYIKTRESLNIRLRRWFAEESHIPLRIRSLDDVHLGLPVLVKCQSFCRRAVIQEVNAGTGGVTIWLVDFGEKRTHVKLWSLLYMPRAFAEIPAQAMKFSLGAAHYNDSDEGLARMRDIAKHFTYSYMQVLDGSDGDFSNCDRKYVDFILRDKGYGQSSSLRHRLVALSLASFDDISQRDMDEMSDVTTLGGPPSTSDGALTLEEKTDLESDRDRTPQYSRSSSPSQPDIVVANGAVSTTHNDAARNPFSARALLPPVPYGRTRISVRDARRQSSQSSSTVSTEQNVASLSFRATTPMTARRRRERADGRYFAMQICLTNTVYYSVLV
ncbi:hypothetical protein Y032_0412g979 [Ancylostoma ceylanicum]|uniref:Tudor domain-containing protein n=2 Tax=Ancylostoma ceylanicum TaxID=53326 RepID=A0A016X400_9BILA|nr:hypothetical protein Y032_0412g979 [Ancylostoma ceylanicum]